MRVLMQIRQNAYSLKGGDTIQMEKTREELIKLGYNVDISLDLHPDLSEYDVVHLFNITRVQETFIQVQNAVKQGKPIVLSTIYWPNNEFEKFNGGLGLRGILGKLLTIDQMESVKALAKALALGQRDEGTRYLITHSYQKMQKYILEYTNVFLPNAQEEMRQIELNLGYYAKPNCVIVVPNAIDINAMQKAAQNDKTNSYRKYKDWLICVGRIDPRKNQLKLLEAIEKSNYKLLLVGKCSAGQKNYFHKVMQKIKGNPNIEYLEQVPNDELYQIYRQCKVSVLPSWFETPGLVSLEAASMGCNIVVSEKGTTKDYFGKYAYYCDVMDPSSIRKQIDKAYRKPFDEAFKEKIIQEYTWEKAAQKTAEGYELALEGYK